MGYKKTPEQEEQLRQEQAIEDAKIAEYERGVYEFAGFLSTQPGLLEVGAEYNAGALADRITEFFEARAVAEASSEEGKEVEEDQEHVDKTGNKESEPPVDPEAETVG